VDLEWGLLSLVNTREELLARSSGSELEIREYGHRDVTLTTWHPLSVKVDTNFANKRWSLGIVRSWTQATEFSLVTCLQYYCYK
jgi:hypothetical protein